MSQLKDEIFKLYETTPDNVCGTAVGYKHVNNAPTPVKSVVFYVAKKLPLAEIPESERIPATITVAGVEYPTDVVERSSESITLWSSCYNPLQQDDPEISRLQGQANEGINTGALLPMRGGQEIGMLPYSDSVGTLGFFAVDETDGKIVGVTNTHVVMSPVWFAKDVARPPSLDVLQTKNTIEPDFCPSDGKKYPASATIRDNYDWHVAALHVKRYSPLRSYDQTLNEVENGNWMLDKKFNYVDAALLIMNPGTFGDTNTKFVGPQSYAIRRPLDVESEDTGAPPSYPFATTAEMDALLNSFASNPALEIQVYSTGRTSGPKGYCSTKRIIISAVHVTQEIGNSTPGRGAVEYDNVVNGKGIACFKDVFIVSRADDADDDAIPGDRGDSGSAVLADISGTRKIIGILFAGQPTSTGGVSVICRIDKVAQLLNIRAWDPATDFLTESSLNAALTVPNPVVITRPYATETNDFGSDLSVIENSNTYWHAGATLQEYSPDNLPPTDIELSNDSVYEGNRVGHLVGQLSAVDPDTTAGIIDVYQFSLTQTVTHPDNAAFTIVSNQLRAAAVFNYSAKSTYTIKVKATNTMNQSVDKELVITVLEAQ